MTTHDNLHACLPLASTCNAHLHQAVTRSKRHPPSRRPARIPAKRFVNRNTMRTLAKGRRSPARHWSVSTSAICNSNFHQRTYRSEAFPQTTHVQSVGDIPDFKHFNYFHLGPSRNEEVSNAAGS